MYRQVSVVGRAHIDREVTRRLPRPLVVFVEWIISLIRLANRWRWRAEVDRPPIGCRSVGSLSLNLSVWFVSFALCLGGFNCTGRHRLRVVVAVALLLSTPSFSSSSLVGYIYHECTRRTSVPCPASQATKPPLTQARYRFVCQLPFLHFVRLLGSLQCKFDEALISRALTACPGSVELARLTCHTGSSDDGLATSGQVTSHQHVSSDVSASIIMYIRLHPPLFTRNWSNRMASTAWVRPIYRFGSCRRQSNYEHTECSSSSHCHTAKFTFSSN